MKKIVFVAFLAFIVAFSSCEKYDDGGNSSSASRHIIGVWNYETVYVNEEKADTAAFKNTYEKSTIEFKKGSEVVFTYRNREGNVDTTYSGTYLFTNNKTVLTIAYPSSLKRDNEDYSIKKLTSKELTLEALIGQKSYRYEMKQ